MKDKDEGSYALTEKKENFSEWFHQLIKVADIIDQRYPFQGFLVYKPYGYGILNNCFKILEEELEKTGHGKSYFPLIIPEHLMAKEKDHIAGFHDQVFWITHAGKSKLGEQAALRPTSETAMYTMFSLWIRSWRDLPLKVHQSTSVFRYETKHTRPLIRDREILWNEAHTCHASAEEAVAQIKTGIVVYKKVFDSACIPVVFLEATDIFAGAVSATEAFTIFPDGRALEMGSVNNLGQRFSKAFDVKFRKEDGTEDFVHQTCYGISERVLGAVIAIHGDDKGLVIPPKIAPIQVVIIPIIFEKHKEKVLNKANELCARLKKICRVYLDASDDAVGSKFYNWEIKGVPIRIEIGPKEVDKSVVTITRRLDGEKSTISEKNIEEYVNTMLENIQNDMEKNAENYHRDKLVETNDKDDIARAIESRRFLKIAWCGSIDCAKTLEKSSDLSFIGYEKKPGGKCIECSKDAAHTAYIGKTY